MFFRTRTRKIIRDVWSRKARTALVSINIFISVLGVVTLTSVSDIIISQLKRDLREDEIAMLSAWTRLDEGATVNNEATLTTLRAHSGVAVAEAWLNQRLFWKFPGDTGFIESQIRAFSEPFDQLQIEPFHLKEGVYPVVGEKQLVIEQRMAKRYDLAVGDEIIIRVLKNLDQRTDPTAPLPEESWTISGIVVHPYIWAGDSSLYAHYADVQTLSDEQGYNYFAARFTDFPTALEQRQSYIDRLEDQTPYEVQDSNFQDPADNEFLEEVGQWSSTLIALAGLAMIVSGFLVFTVISTIVVEQRQQIGAMKAIGATRPDNFSIYSGMAVVYGVLGTIFGVLLGIPAGFYLAKTLSNLVNIIVEDFTISYTGALVGIVMGLATPFLAAIFPVYMGTRISILNAITDLGISSKYGGSRISHLIGNLPVPIVMRQALANIYQKRGRLALTGFTLTLAVGAFMGVSAVFLSMNNATDDIFATYNYQLAVFPQDDQQLERMNQLLAANYPQIENLTPALFADVDILLNEMNTYIFRSTAFDPASDLIHFNLEEGSGWESDPTRQGVVITQKVAETLGKGMGDTLTLRYEDSTFDAEVIGIDRYPYENVFIPLSLLNQPAQVLAVKFDDPDLTASDVDRLSGDIRETLLLNAIQVGFYNQVADEEENADLILQVGLLFNIASGVMAAVGAVGLLTMLSISVYERQREIGVMRSVGATSGVVASQFLIEGLMVGVIAWVIGIPVSYGISLLLLEFIPVGDFGFSYPIIIIGAGLVGMLIIALVASLYPSLSAARKTVSDILRYQ